MPIFDNNGKKQNVQDAHVEKYMELYPDATTIMERDGKKYRVKAKDYNTFLGDTLEAPKMESAPQPAPQVEAEPQQGFFTGVKAQIADTAKQAMQKPRDGEKAADKREQSTSSLDAMPSESGLREENGYTFTADELGIAEGKGKVEAEPTSVTTATEKVAASVKTGASAAVPGERAWWQNAAKIMGKEEAKPQMYGPMTKELMEEQQMLVEGRSIPQADIEAALPQANASMLQKMHEGATMQGAFDRAYGAAKGVYYADEAERLTKGLLDEYSAERAKRLSQVEKDVENYNSARRWAVSNPYATDAYSEVAYRSNATKLRNADELGMMEEFAKDAKKRLLADENLKAKAEENAELLGMPVERYINEVAVPIMQERMYSEWLAPQEERAKRNYNGLAVAAEGSLIGTLLGATRTDTEKYLSQVGQEAWRKNASLLGRAAAGAGSMFLDLPVFMGAGSLASVPAKAVGGQVFKQLAKNETKRLVARGVAEGAAQRYANYAVRNGLKNRILLNLSTAPLQSGLTFGMFDAGKAALNMSLNGEWDWKELGKSAVGGTLMGGALGATGAVGGGLTHGLTGATKAAAKVAEFGVENAVFTEGGRLIGKLHGQQPENGWLEDYVESGATLLMIKAPNIVKNVSAIKGDKEASEVFAFNRLEREQLGKYGEDLNAVLESLLPKSGRLYEDGLKINEGTFTEEYRRVMSDPEVPMTAKAKLMGIVEGKMMLAPKVVDAKIEGNRVMTYDPMGRLVEVKEYATEAKANAEYKKVANAAEIESIAVMEDVYMRIKGYEADELTVKEWLAKNPKVTMERVAEIVAKNSAGEKLTEAEQKILESLRQARREGLNDVRHLNDVLAGLDVDAKDVMSGLDKPIDKRTERENRAVRAYTDVLFREVKDKIQEPYRRGEAQRAADDVWRAANNVKWANEDVKLLADRIYESDRSVDETANDGMVYTTTTPSGEKIIITGGKVVLDNEGYIDVNQSEGLVAMFPDGSRKPIRPGDLREKVEVSNAEEMKAVKREEIEQEIAAENGWKPIEVGAEYDVVFDGDAFRVKVEGRDENGDVIISGEGASMSLPESVVQDAMKQAETLQAESEVAPVVEGQKGENAEKVVEPVDEAAAFEQNIPVDEKGKKMWEQSTPEYIAEYIRVRKPEDVEAQMSVVSGMIEGLEKQKSKMDAMDAMDIDDKIAFWKKVGELIGGAKDVVDPISQLNAKHSSALTAFNSMLENIRRESNEQKAAIRYEGLENMVAELGKQLPEGYMIGVVDGKYTIVEAQPGETTPVVESAPVEEVETPQATNEMQEADLENAEKGQNAVEPVEENNESTLSQTSDQVAEGENAPGQSGVQQNESGKMYSSEELAEAKEQLGELNATSAPEFAARLFSIKPWKTLEEANAALKELLASYGETLNGQSLAVMPFLDKAQGLIREYNKSQELGSVEEVLENGDKRITNYNSRGEVATVATERDGKIVSVDSYDEGVLFEHTEYDGNGKAAKVTRYDKSGNVVGTQKYVDGKAVANEPTELPETPAEVANDGPVNRETLQLNMSEEDFNALLNSGDKAAIGEYLAEMDGLLRIGVGSPLDGRDAIVKEYRGVVEQYGGEENIPADVVAGFDERIAPYNALQRAVFDRKYALLDKLREIEANEAQAKEQAEKEAKAEHKKIAFGGFLSGKTDLGASAAEKALSKKYNFDGKVMTVAEFVEDAVGNGNVKLSAIEEPKYKGASRAAWNRMDARQQEADAKRVKESGTKTVYTVNDHDFGKTAYDYAKFLLDKKAEQEKAAAKQKVKDAIEPFAKEKAAEQAPIKIEDVGEKIGGARKDVIRKYADKIKLDGKTFGTMFPKPEIDQLVEAGLPLDRVAAVKAMFDNAKREYERTKKRMGKDKALSASLFYAMYAKNVLNGETDNFDLKYNGWVFTDWGKEYMKANIALYRAVFEKLGAEYGKMDLAKYAITPLDAQHKKMLNLKALNESNARMQALRAKEKGEEPPVYKDGDLINFVGENHARPSDQFETLEEAVNAMVERIGKEVKPGAEALYKPEVYWKTDERGRADYSKIFVGVKVRGFGTVDLMEFKSSNEARQWLDEHGDDFQQMAAAKEVQVRAENKKPLPKYSIEYTLDRVNSQYAVVANFGRGKVHTLRTFDFPEDDARARMSVFKDEVMPFLNSQEAVQAANEYAEELQQKKSAPKNVVVEKNSRERVGVDWRNGQDATTEMFVDVDGKEPSVFGFRALEFGNYVSQKERQQYLNDIYDALMDMSEVLGVSPRALSLGGKLALAVGARGTSGASGHYEPYKNVINITKTKGAGVLAHEWLHALDRYFSNFDENALYPNGVRYATGKEYAENTRQEIKDAFEKIMSAVRGGEYQKRSARLGDYWASDKELAARALQDYMMRKLDERGQKNDFLSNHLAPEDWAGDMNNYPFPLGAEADRIAESFDKFFATVEEKTKDGQTVLFQQGMIELDRENPAFERATENVRKKLEATGVKVKVLTKEEAESELARLEELADMQKRKSLETALPEDESSFKGTAISSDDGAKILKDIDSAIAKYENSNDRAETFIGNVAKALGIDAKDKSSKYATFEAKNGVIFTIRISNHNATVSNFDNAGEGNGISIVISRKPNEGVINDGNAHLVEFFYPEKKISKAAGKPLVEILKSIKQALYSGEYKDNTGLAQPEEVNVPEFLRTSDGVTYGWAVNGEIYLTPEGLNPNTPIHEYTHLWAAALQKSNPKLWNEVVEAMKLSPVWNEVMADENYTDIHGDENRVASEVLSRLSGNEGYRRYMEQAEKEIAAERDIVGKVQKKGILNRIRNAVSRFWNWLKGKLGSKAKAGDGTEAKAEPWDVFVNKTLKDFDEGVNPDAKDSPLDRMFIGKKGAANLDKAEEATTRLDNLNVAREMETGGKDAKAIKLATGWERGADGKWRYEVMDDFELDLDANVAYGKRNPEVIKRRNRWRELLHKGNALAFEGELLSADETAEFESLSAEFKGTQLHNSRTLKDYIDAPELFEAYPEVADIKVSIEALDENEKGSYSPIENIIRLNNELGKGEIKSTLNHEIQHAIQYIEGFARGGNTEDVLTRAQALRGDVRPLYDMMLETPEWAEKKRLVNRWLAEEDKAEPDRDYQAQLWERIEEINNSGVLDDIQQLQDRLIKKYGLDRTVTEIISGPYAMDAEVWSNLPESFYDKYDAYKRLAGEVEARNVQERMGMTAEERRNSLAEETYMKDVAKEDQTFIFDNLGVSSSQEVAPEQDIPVGEVESKPISRIDLSNGPVRGVDEPEWKFKARREKWRRWVESNTSVKIPMPEKPFLQEGEPIEVYEERMKEFNKALNRWKKDILSKDSEIEEMLNILYDGKSPKKNPTPEDEFTEQVFKRYMGDDGIRVDRKSMRGMIMDEIIERRRKIETNNFDDVVFINEVRKATTAEQRKAIPFIIEGTYNGEVSKELRVVVQRIKDWFENVYQALQAADAMHSSGKIKNYVTHIWDKNRTPKAVYENYINTRSKYTNRRSIDTYAEGIALGMVPKYDDICDIMLEYGHIANEAIANKDFTDFLHMLRVDGEPVLKDVTIRDTMYVRTSSEALDGYKVHKYAKGIVENVLGTVRTENAPEWMQKLAHFYDVSGSLMKKINLSLSFFHHGALLETAVGAMNPAKAVSTVFKNLVWDCMRSGELPALSNPEATRNAVNHLVQLGATQDYMAKEVNRLTGRLKEVLKDFSDKHPNLVTKGVVKPAELLDFLNTGFDKVLWDYLHDGLKIYTFDKYAKEIEEYTEKKGIGDTEKDMLLNEAGQLVNDIYGGQFWELIDVSPAAVKWLRRLLLSPDWTISTIRQALSPIGFGTLYKDYEKNWAQRTVGTGLSASFRRKQGVKFWITALLTFGALMNGLNAWRRKEDVDGELEKAEERRKTDSEYKSPYELKYPDGMKWYDYTMAGNTIGHQTHLFGWRYDDGKEGYVRWGKQFRELPELFLGKDGFSFPGPMIDKMVGKANPALSASLAFLGYAKDGWQSKWMKDKKGWEKELGRVMMMASAFMPYSIPTDEDKEFMLTDLMMPSSKGFSNNKAIRGFETAILSQDFDYVGAVYDACVMNKLDAEKLLQAAIARVEAQAKAEYVEGANTLNEAWDKYQEDLEINEKRAVRTKFNKLLQENAYKDFAKQEARDMVQSVIDGTYREEKLPEAYIASETAEDVRDAYKMDAIRLRLKKVVDDIPEDAVAYKQYYNDNKAKIDLYDETVAAKREINLIMEDIKITPQFTEQYMQEIRDIRREIIEMANNLTGNNE